MSGKKALSVRQNWSVVGCIPTLERGNDGNDAPPVVGTSYDWRILLRYG